jgi:23S rRNA pseudouridine1911/1915/1917 synthase
VTLRFIADEAADGQRVDKWLAATVPDVSRAKIQAWIVECRVRIDGRTCRSRDALAEGNVIEVDPGEPPASRAEPDASVLIEVVHEDEHLLVVNKPAGMVVHPARGHASGTLVNGLLARGGFSRASADPLDKFGHFRPGIVHRIDKETSGLLVVTKTDAAREGLKDDLATHRVERVYQAITCGVPSVTEIRSMYGRHPKSRLRFTSLLNEGKPAVTYVKLLEIMATSHAALVECRLETGRTHQIRVHLAEKSETPILADKLYRTRLSSDVLLKEAAAAIGRQALHAGVLGFEHPITKEPLRFEVPAPAEFHAALEILRLTV